MSEKKSTTIKIPVKLLPDGLRARIRHSLFLKSLQAEAQKKSDIYGNRLKKDIERYLTKIKHKNPKAEICCDELKPSQENRSCCDKPQAEPQKQKTAVEIMREGFKISMADGRIEKAVEDCLEIVAKKNHDYASPEDPWENFRMSDETGIPTWQAVFVRYLDKVSRIKGFIKRGVLKVTDESIEDTMNDLINYAVIMKVLFKEKTPEKIYRHEERGREYDEDSLVCAENTILDAQDSRERLNDDF